MTAYDYELATAPGPSPAVAGLDRLTRLAARVLRAPVCGVALATAEHRSPWWHQGSRYVIDEAAPLISADIRTDPRLCDDPTIGEQEAVAYAGYPLRGPRGPTFGAFFVADLVPRRWTDDDLETLSELAGAAESEIALRVANGEVLLSSTRLRTVLESATDAFVSMDPDGLVTAWNAAAERLFGWPAADALGRTATELMIPLRFRAAHDQGLARVRRSGNSDLAGQRLEMAAVDRSGREFPIEMTVQMHLDQGVPVFHAFLHDITARTTARTELEQERVFLQALLNSLDTGVAACDSEGHLAQFNPAMRGILEVGQPVTDPQWWADAYHLCRADGQTPMRADEVPLNRAYAGETVRHEEVVVRLPGRPARRFLANARPMDTPDGRRLGAVVAMHEITDAHRAEMLRRCRHAVAVVLSEATSAREAAVAAAGAVAGELEWTCAEYWEVDEERTGVARVSSWVRPGADLAGFTGDVPLVFTRGQGLPGAVWERDAGIWSHNLLRDLADPGRLALGFRLGLSTTIGLPVHSGSRVAGVLAFYTDGEVSRDDDILGMLHDVAAQISRFVERRRAEDLTLALAAARRDFNRVIEQVNDCYWTVEAMPGGEVRSVYSSPGATGVFGGKLRTDSDMATVLAERTHPEDREMLQAFHETVSRGQPAEFESRILGFDGQTRWVWTRGVTRTEDGHLYVDGISTNVTERRELADQREELLAREQQQVRQLREVDRMKDELVAVVSHELRNPIAIIAAYTDELLDEPEFAGRDELVVIERTSAHLLHLVEDLLDLARFDSGHAALDAKPLRPERLLRQAVEDHRRNAEAQSITLLSEFGPLPVLPGDGARLRQVLDNLLSNAIKYTPSGGTVRVGAHATDDTTVVTVTDTGIGVPAEQYSQLFTRFFRASTATSRKIKGTGLGLAVSKAIVEAHGGTITASPGSGGGTLFTVTLPR